MNGFLQRLATQAMGNTNTLHTIARQPYAAQPLPANTEVHDNRHPVSRTPVDEQHQTNSSGTQHETNLIAPSSPEILIEQSSPESTKNPERANTQHSSAATKTFLSNANVEQTVADQSTVVANEIALHIHEEKSAIRTIFHNKQESTHPDSDVLPQLLPLSNARPKVSNAGAVTPRDMSRDTALQAHIEETTEVHVSIGRIEVTAVHEAQPPKRQAPTSTKPMSLDEYLARRKREA